MKLKYSLCALALMGLVSACDTPMGIEKPEGSITPGTISNVRVDNSTPGHLVLRWDKSVPEGTDLLYVRAEYHDPYYKKDMVRLGSAHGDSILIPNTYVAGGEYSFKLTPVSSTLSEGAPTTVAGTSSPVEPVRTPSEKGEELKLTLDDIATNAQEPNEGPIANAIDRNKDSFFHTLWSHGISEHHNFQFRLTKPCVGVVITINPRHNGANSLGDVPQEVLLFASKDGKDWTPLPGEYSFPKPNDQDQDVTLYRTDGGRSAGELSSQAIPLPEGTQYVRFDNVKNYKGSAFFNFSEIYVYEAIFKVYDREAEGKMVIDGKAEPVPNAK